MSVGAIKIMTAKTVIGDGDVVQPAFNKQCFQANLTGVGQVDAVVDILGSLDGVKYCATPIGTIVLSGAAGASYDGFVSLAPWTHVKPNLRSISGTSAAVDVWMGE